jgi:hypothetical protein
MEVDRLLTGVEAEIIRISPEVDGRGRVRAMLRLPEHLRLLYRVGHYVLVPPGVFREGQKVRINLGESKQVTLT